MSLLSQCNKCGQEVELKTLVRGILLVVTWSCPHRHEVHWQSQPTVRNMAAGNLLVRTCSYSLFWAKIHCLCQYGQNTQLTHDSQKLRIQKELFISRGPQYLHFTTRGFVGILRDEGLHLSGDGRCDSPGYKC